MNRALLLLLLPLLAGCAAPFTSSPERQEVLMDEHRAYLDEMRELEQRKGELAYAESWRAAQLGVRLADNGLTPSGERDDWAERALAHADRASVLDPERVEGHYYRAVALGWVLDLNFIKPVSRIPELESAGLRARELDPAFQCAGPLRFLALLYQKAPPWPIGPVLQGEEEEIERLFREALRLAPGCPENQLFFAEFLHDLDRDTEALDVALGAEKNLTGHLELEEFERDALGRRLKDLIKVLRTSLEKTLRK